jgi:tRNA pseudouridine38-40 synthase
MYNFSAVVEYDGTNFKGFQSQPGKVRTVQAELERAITTAAGELKDFTYAGRTDAGVHAKHQVISFKISNCPDLYKLKWKINCLLPEDITVKDICKQEADFNARRDAVYRQYSYFAVNSNCQSVFLKKYSIMIYGKLDFDLMKQACAKFEGIKDYKAFSSDNLNTVSTLRQVHSLKMKRYGRDLIVFKISASSFLYNMVRIIVGTILEVGTGKKDISDIDRAFKTGSRKDAGKIAPAKGLFLTNVVYR